MSLGRSPKTAKSSRWRVRWARPDRGVFQIVPFGGEWRCGRHAGDAGRAAQTSMRVSRISHACLRPARYVPAPPVQPRSGGMAGDAGRERTRDRRTACSIHPQVAARGVGLLLALDGYHPFPLPPVLSSDRAPAARPSAPRRCAMPRVARAYSRRQNVAAEDAPSDPDLGLDRRAFTRTLDRFYVGAAAGRLRA